MPALSPWLLVSGAGMTLVGVLAVLGVTRGARSLWRPAGIGAAAWVVAVLLKMAWALPTNSFVHGRLRQVAGTSVGEPLFWVYVGLLTGVFECGLTALVVARSNLRKATWREALAFGTAFGVIEAVALGVVSLLGVAFLLLFYDVLPAETRARIATQLVGRAETLPLILPIFERLGTLFIHAFSCVVIVYGFKTRRALRWFVLAFAYKSAVDGVAAWGILALKARESIEALVRLEVLMVPFAVVGLIGLVLLYGRMQAPAAAPEPV